MSSLEEMKKCGLQGPAVIRRRLPHHTAPRAPAGPPLRLLPRLSCVVQDGPFPFRYPPPRHRPGLHPPRRAAHGAPLSRRLRRSAPRPLYRPHTRIALGEAAPVRPHQLPDTEQAEANLKERFEKLNQQLKHTTKELVEERARSDRLLHQMLPPEVADSLRHGAAGRGRRVEGGVRGGSCAGCFSGGPGAARLRGSRVAAASPSPHARARCILPRAQATRWTPSRTLR